MSELNEEQKALARKYPALHQKWLQDKTNENDLNYQYARRKALVCRIRRERCSRCEYAWRDERKTGILCENYMDNVTETPICVLPFWHMACFKERE